MTVLTHVSAQLIAHRLAGKRFSDLACEDMTVAWQLQCAGYLFVRGNYVCMTA